MLVLLSAKLLCCQTDLNLNVQIFLHLMKCYCMSQLQYEGKQRKNNIGLDSGADTEY